MSARFDHGAKIADAAKALAGCRRLLVLTGAGLSADAGVATFRGAGGLWNDYKAEDLASLAGFQRNPELVWDWYRERRMAVAVAEPHPGQRSLALLQKHYPGGQVMVATTNEDDLLERAGVDPVVHLHGSLFDTICSQACGWRARDGEDNSLSMVPCPTCGAATRPGSVWYGESLPPGMLEQVSAFDADGCLLVGSSCLVQPVSSIPGELAALHPVVEVNVEETHFSDAVACSLRGTAKDLLPGLVDLLTSHTVRDQQDRSG